MFLDGRRVSDASMVYLPSFFATAGYDRKGRAVVLKATNYHKQPVRARLWLEGAQTVGAEGRQIVIRSDGLYDENSLDHPRRIVPREEPLPNCASQFSVTLPPYSVNVLRIPASIQR